MPRRPRYFIFASNDPNPPLIPGTVFWSAQSQTEAAHFCAVALVSCNGGITFDYAAAEEFSKADARDLRSILAALAHEEERQTLDREPESLPDHVRTRLVLRRFALLWSNSVINPERSSPKELAAKAPDSARLSRPESVHAKLHCAFHYARAYEAVLNAATWREDLRSDPLLQEYYASVVNSLRAFISGDPFLDDFVGPFEPIVEKLSESGDIPFPKRTAVEHHKADLLRRIVAAQHRSARAGGTLSPKAAVQDWISGVESETLQIREYAADQLRVPKENVEWVTRKKLGPELYDRYRQLNDPTKDHYVRQRRRSKDDRRPVVDLAFKILRHTRVKGSPSISRPCCGRRDTTNFEVVGMRTV
ncbi:MAG: hypothetical protein ACFHWZ_03425 [Phycisphaerales bacterium]